MRIEAISVEEAMAEGTKLPFIFLRNLSSIHVGKMIQEINIEELIEAK